MEKYGPSDDGDSWDDRTNTMVTSETLYSVAYNGTNWVATGSSGNTVFQSTDNGETWSLKTGPTGIRSIGSDGSGFVIGTSNGKVFISSDGDSWGSAITTPITTSIHLVTYANSLYIAGGQSGNIVVSSDGGASWDEETTLATGNLDIGVATDGNSVLIGGGAGAFTSTIRTPGALDSVSYTFDREHGGFPILPFVLSNIPGNTTDTDFAILENTFLAGEITAGRLTGLTLSSITKGNKLTSTTTGDRTDLTVVATGVVGSTLVPTVTVQTQGETGVTELSTSYNLTASTSHSPQTLSSSFPNDQLVADARIRIRNHFVNGDIGNYEQPTAIGSNSFFDVTSSFTGVDSPNLQFTITTPGTGGDLVATDVVQRQGGVIIDQITATISGGGLTSDVTVGPSDQITSVQLNTALNTAVASDSAVTIANESEGRVLTGAVEIQHPAIGFSVNKGHTGDITRDIRTLTYGN